MSKHRRISTGTFFGPLLIVAGVFWVLHILLVILGISIVFNRGRGFAPRYFNKIDLKKGAGKEGDESRASSEDRIDESTIFGGADIRIPESWIVQTRSSSVLGGVDAKYSNTEDNTVKRLVINASAIFDGVDIKNAWIIYTIWWEKILLNKHD